MGKEIRRLRRARGLKLNQLAERSGFSVQYLGGIERAERNVGVTAIFQVAHALGVPASDFLRNLP
jgi:transcriptional regulator with XRE-family HTH domain